MDFEKLLKNIGDPDFLDKEELGVYADAYFKRLHLITSISRNLKEILPGMEEEFLATHTKTIQVLSDQMEEKVDEYTKKHGEL
jgi:hypothetical protein